MDQPIGTSYEPMVAEELTGQLGIKLGHERQE
jgi:hypothetical protein